MDPLPSQPVTGRSTPDGPAPARPRSRRRASGQEPSPAPPLPRRARPAAEAPDDAEPPRDPDGRPLQPVDDAMLHRLLSGLRDI